MDGRGATKGETGCGGIGNRASRCAVSAEVTGLAALRVPTGERLIEAVPAAAGGLKSWFEAVRLATRLDRTLA
jgi:hypothetical protein